MDKMQNLCADAFVGSLIGQAVGDSLGFLVEGYPAEQCQEYVQHILLKQVIPENTRIPYFKDYGQYTDDTQLAREFLISTRQNNGRVDPSHYALRMARLFQPGAYLVVGYGKQTAAGLEAIMDGLHYSQSGRTETYKSGTGNGGAMRAAPIGLVFARSPDEHVAQIAKTLGAITHASTTAMDGAAVVALAAKHAMLTRDQPFHVLALLQRICQGVEDADFKMYIRRIPTWMQMEKGQAAKEIIKAGLTKGPDGKGEADWCGTISPGVTQTVLWALYSVCMYPDDYINCISTAMWAGGDVDTTAAIAGGIIGARLGRRAVPDVWALRVNDRLHWDHDALVKLATDVHDLVAADKISVTL